MTKKKKRSAQSAGPPKRKTPEPSKKSNYPLLLMAIGVVLLAGGGFYFYKSRAAAPVPVQATASAEVTGSSSGLQETRATLPPEMFSGKVRQAYAIARDIPQVLDKLYCYCRCRENFGHKNLLSCYVDNHAST